MADKQSGRISRRRVLQGIGAAGLTVGVAPFAEAKSAAANGETPIKRIRGTYDSPLKVDEMAELRRSVLQTSRTARMGAEPKDPIAKPALTEDQRIVEFFVTREQDGTPRYYHGSVSNSSDQSLSTARSLADKRERDMQTYAGGGNVNKDDEWNHHVTATGDHPQEPFGIVHNNTEWYQLDPSVVPNDRMIHVSRSHVSSTPGDKRWGYQAPQSRWLNNILKSRNFWGQDYGTTKVQKWHPYGSAESGSFTVSLGTGGFNIGWSSSTGGKVAPYYRGGSTDLIQHKLYDVTDDDLCCHTVGMAPGAQARMDRSPFGCGQGIHRVFSAWANARYKNILGDYHTLKRGEYFGWSC